MGAPVGSNGSGTWFVIGEIVPKYAQMALTSSSLSCPNIRQGMGGKMGRDVPMCFPVRIAWMKSSSVQTPLRSPVSVSGVHFAPFDRGLRWRRLSSWVSLWRRVARRDGDAEQQRNDAAACAMPASAHEPHLVNESGLHCASSIK